MRIGFQYENALYREFVLHNMPRILSQIDRDEDSLTFGSCDRNHWHYKIRDFSSAILQQSGLNLAILHNLEFPGNPYFKNEYIRKIAIGTLDYWTRIQLSDGSFNEYYPNEHGFPPTAFSFFTACEIIKELDLDVDKYYSYLKKTAKYLISHIETKASNQEMGSIAALYSFYTICKEPWVLEGVDEKLNKILLTQSPEGWFPEYGGADFGYLSVCFDMLAEYYHQSNDQTVLEPLNRIVSFIKYFVHPDGTIGGEYGSRNTMYFVPFGLEKMISEGNPDAVDVRNHIYRNIDKFDYFQNSVDDRYFSHYILHSYLRVLKSFSETQNISGMSLNLPCLTKSEKYFSDAGLLSINSGSYFAVCSLRKGGLVKIFNGQEVFSDFGYRILNGKKGIATTNWVDAEYQISYEQNTAFISGKFNLIKPQLSSPIKHIGLRVLSLLFGNKIIGFLKNKLIFITEHMDVSFERKILFDSQSVQIVDHIFSPKKFELKNANSLSLRHVASGKFFKTSELVDRVIINEKNCLDITITKNIDTTGNVDTSIIKNSQEF